MILSAIAPIYLFILAGVLVDRLRLLPAGTGDALAAFSLKVCIPCFIFNIMATATPAQLAQGKWWLGMLGTQYAFLGAFYLAERMRRVPSGPAMVTSLSCTFCNAGFVGLSVVMLAFADIPEALAAGGMMVIASNIVAIAGQMTLAARAAAEGKAASARGAGIAGFLRRYVLPNTILMSTGLGLVFCALGIPVWAPIGKTLQLFGMVSPVCMLFALGMCLRENLARARSAGGVDLGRQVWVCFWKLVGTPLLTLGALLLLGCDPLWTAVSVVVMSTGTAVMVATFAQVYDTVPAQASMTVTVTNLLSLLSIMGFLWLVSAMGLVP